MDKQTLPPMTGFVSTGEVTVFRPSFTPRAASVASAKRGDWVQLMIKFPLEGKMQAEFLSGKVAGVNPTAGLLKVRILSNPEQTARHSLTYGDDVTVSQGYILTHDSVTAHQATAEDYMLTGVQPPSKPVNAEDAKLREVVKHMPAFAPQLADVQKAGGKRFWLRDGSLATVWTLHNNEWLGRTDDGRELSWTLSGAHANDRNLDIVKDPKQSEVLA